MEAILLMYMYIKNSKRNYFLFGIKYLCIIIHQVFLVVLIL